MFEAIWHVLVLALGLFAFLWSFFFIEKKFRVESPSECLHREFLKLKQEVVSLYAERLYHQRRYGPSVPFGSEPLIQSGIALLREIQVQISEQRAFEKSFNRSLC